jgi:predicted nucleotidyltransferase
VFHQDDNYKDMPLSDSFLQSILENIDAPAMIGVGIIGSYARGQADKYSDVDIDIYVSKMPENPYDRYTLRYWDDKLVSLKYTLLDDERAALTDPRRAIWAVPGILGMKVLLDKDGSLAALQKAAQKFDWSP